MLEWPSVLLFLFFFFCLLLLSFFYYLFLDFFFFFFWGGVLFSFVVVVVVAIVAFLVAVMFVCVVYRTIAVVWSIQCSLSSPRPPLQFCVCKICFSYRNLILFNFSFCCWFVLFHCFCCCCCFLLTETFLSFFFLLHQMAHYLLHFRKKLNSWRYFPLTCAGLLTVMKIHLAFVLDRCYHGI